MPVSDVWMILLPVPAFADLNCEAPAFDGECIRSHGGKLFGNSALYRINGSKNTNQGHYPKCNDKHGKYGPQFVRFYRTYRHPQILNKRGIKDHSNGSFRQ